MKTKNIMEYVLFGRVINFLRFLKDFVPYHKKNMVKDSLEMLISYVDKLNLSVTSRVRWFKLLKDYKELLDKTDKNYQLTKTNVKDLTDLMNRLGPVINAELEGRIVFIITEKRMKVDRLLNNIEDLFAQDVFIKLPFLPKLDFNEGGKCIAFERPTAGAFHVLRSMEGILRWFYDKLNNSSGCSDNWGNVIRNLRSMSAPPPSEIIDQLDAIRLNYRNPTAHPELVYTIDDIQDLLSECIAVVNRIVHHLKDKGII